MPRVTDCPTCKQRNPDQAKVCPECGRFAAPKKSKLGIIAVIVADIVLVVGLFLLIRANW